MSPNHNAGHINKREFMTSVIVMLVITLLAAGLRFYIRLRLRRQRLGVDDYFLLLGLAFLCGAVGVLFAFIEPLYLVAAFVFNIPGIYIPPDFMDQLYTFHIWVTVGLELLWAAGCAVKFSFLALFYNLVRRQPRMQRYWWLTTAVTVVASIFGVTAYILPCPWFDFERSFNCSQGMYVRRVLIYGATQIATDILSDLMILAIPFCIIWRVRIRLSQKLGLGSSLCLTIVMIGVTIVRLVGLRHNGAIDSLWEVYWQFMAAEVGLLMTAATALRSLFVARAAAAPPPPLLAAAAHPVAQPAKPPPLPPLPPLHRDFLYNNRNHKDDCELGHCDDSQTLVSVAVAVEQNGSSSGGSGTSGRTGGSHGDGRALPGPELGWGPGPVAAVDAACAWPMPPAPTALHAEGGQRNKVQQDVVGGRHMWGRRRRGQGGGGGAGMLGRMVGYRLPAQSLPRATMTGLRTFIRGGGGASANALESEMASIAGTTTTTTTTMTATATATATAAGRPMCGGVEAQEHGRAGILRSTTLQTTTTAARTSG